MSPIGSYRYLIKLNKFSKNEAEKRSSFFKSDREKVKPFLRILHTGKEWPFKTTESSKHYLYCKIKLKHDRTIKCGVDKSHTRSRIDNVGKTSVAEPPLFWAAPAPEVPSFRSRLRLRPNWVGSSSRQKKAAPGGSGSLN